MRRYAALSGGGLFALLLLTSTVTLAAPPAFAQVETVTGLELHPDEQYRESTYIKQQDGYTWEVDIETGELYRLYEQTSVDFADQPDYPNVEPTSTVVQNDDGSFTMTTHNEYISDSAGIYRPYILAQDSEHVQVKLANGKISIDKTECASTYFDIDENIILKSETYNVRTATIDTDVWNHLDVNDVACSVTVEETEESIDGFKVTDAVVVTLSKVNSEGLFDLEYKISPDGVKTTAYFTNQSYQNNKFAFTQSVQLDDPVVTLNGDEYDLSQMRGANFDRETLEQNIDLVLQAKALFFNAGLGFDQLWNVNISSTVPLDVIQVNLDYGRQGENQIAIGETLELDPTFKWVPSWSKNKMDPEWGMGIGTSTSFAACGQGNGTVVTYGVNYLAPFTWNGCRATVFHYDISAIPDNATITDVDVVYGISLGAGTAGTQHPDCNWNSIEAQSVGLNRHGESNHYSVDWWDDINNLTTHPNRTGVTYVANDANCSTPPSPSGGGHQHAHVMDLGATAVSHVQDQLKASTSVNGVADWFSLGYPFNTVSGPTGVGVTSLSTYNYGLSVTYTTTPDPVGNLAVTQTSSTQADLTWDAGASNTENWIIGNKSVTYANDIDAPNTWMGWDNGSTPTTPSLSTSCGVLGQGLCLNGVSDNIGDPLISSGSGANNGGVSYTEATISAWIKPTASSASPGNPFMSSGVGHYWIQNGQWSAYYPAQSMNWGSQYSGPNIYQQDEWTHLVVTIDDNATNSDGTLGTQKMYIDGQWVQFCGYPGCTLGPGTTTDSFGKTASASLSSVLFGGHNHLNQSAKYAFEGAIDEYTSWNKVLDYAEIVALHHGTPQDAIDANGATSGVTKDNLLNYLDFEENSFPIKNKAHQSDPGTQTYTIKRDGTQIATGITTESYNDTTVTAPNTYQYEVLSVTSGGTSSPSQDEISPGDAASWIGSTSGDCTANGGVWSSGSCYYQGNLTTDTVTIVDDNSNSSCDNTGATYSQYSPDGKYEWVGVDAGGDCYRTFFEFPLDTIPDSATITDVSLSLNFAWYSGTPKACDFTKLSTQPTTDTLANVFNAIGTSTEYTTDQRCEVDVLPTASKTFEEVGLGSTAISDLQSQLANDWFAVGVKYDDESFDGSDHMSRFNDNWASSSPKPTLMVQYTGGTSASVDMINTPDAPTNLVAVTGSPIDMTWTAPANNGGAAITDYQIYRDGSALATVGSTATNYTDSAIVGGTSYTYEVAAINSMGAGAKSNQSTAIAGTEPGAPTGVVATAVPNQINLVWVTPGDDGGVAITGYKVYRSDNLVSPIATLGVVNAWNGDTTGTLGVSYTYNVHAVNSIGDSAAGTSNAVVFGDVPAKVVISLVQALAGLAIKIDWAEPASNGYGITTYLVEYTTDSGSNWNTVGTTANLTLNHSSLTEATLYEYRVSATNALGTGVVSDTSSSVIAGDVPDAPSGHSATAQTGNEIDLAWTEPDDHEYSIDEYRIYRSLTSGGTYTLLVDGLTGLTHTDSSLADGQDYYYKIQAHNSLGWSADSSIVSATAGDIPDQVTGLTSTAVAGSLVDLAWNAAGDNGLTISAYTVEESADNSTWSTLATLGNVTSYQATYTASDNGSTKYWRVSATNSLGTGAVSTNTNTIIGDVPGQITGLTATAQSASEIDLSWNVPADNGYAITVYKIEQSLDNSNWTTLTSNHATTTYSDTGLTASTDYYYKVSGNNALGIGTASSSVQEKTFGVPNDITDLALSVQSTTQINLSWTAPNLNGYTLVDYEVFQSEDGTTWTSITEQTGTTLNVTGLNVNDVYYFKVTTENTYGTSGDSNIENAPTLPLPPATVTPTTISDTEITITWNQPVGDQQSGYKIERSTDDTNYSIIVADTGNTNTSYADTGLTPLTTYYYKVSTINASGTSAASSSSFTETYGAPDAPTNLVATSLTQAHIKLDWVAPGDNNGAAVSGYKIERGTDGTNFSVLVADTATTAVTYTDTTGTAGTTYYYRISSINTYGTGVPSNVDSALSTDVPAQVTGLSATAQPNFEIDLAWTAPSDGGSAITGYKIERSLDNTTWSDLVPTTGNQNVTYTDINLASGQDYYYRVSAINLVGAGTASSVATNQAGDIPDTVTVLSATAQAGSEIVVTWTAPSDNDYAITSYTVERSTDQTTWTTAGGGASTTFTDTGLTDGTTYYYRVFSTNALGNSATSSVVNDLAGDKPDQTTGLTGVALNETQIKLDWTAPGDNAYSITGYKIEVSPDNATWTTVVADTQTNAVTYTHTGLTTVTTYYHKVSAINALGTGNASSSVQTTTMGVPDAITTLSGTAAINSINDARTDITLTWTAPTNNGSAISHYNVQVLSVSDGVTWLTLANNVTGTSTLHSNALGDTQFSYRVFAINAIGISNASNTAQVWSLPTVPLGTAATATSDTTISVSWTELTNGTTYRIEHSTDNVTWSSESNPATSTYGDTGLTIDTLHYYRVFAINPSGESPSSPATSATTFSYPDPPTNLTATPTPTNLLEVNLAWNHPADTGGDAILNYIVERSPDGTSWSSLPSNCPPATDCDYNYFVDGVAQSNTYYYRVIGENSVGMDVVNGYSNIVTYTSPTPAFAPSNLSVEPVGTNNDAATISWTAPTNTGTHAITGYKVERAINSGSWTTAIETTNTNTAVQDSNLIVGNNYQYRVFTITFAGYSTSPSNMDSIEMLDITFTINGSTLGGNTIAIQPDILFSDGSHAPTVTEIRLFENSGFDNNNTNTPETLQQNITWGADIMYAYPNEESTYFAIATLDNGAITTWTSNSVTLTPASPFSGDLQFTEIRDATSNWGTSELNLEIQPAGSDVIIKYQEEGNVGYDTSTGICINNCPVITGWSNVQQAITSTTANLDPDKTYYISVYVQPTFEYPPIVVDGDPVAMTCTSSSSPDCQDGNIPKAYPSDIAIKSAASIYAPPSLGIDQLGNLFGMPLVFVFVVGLAAVFTGRSAQMGIIFLAATLGIMAYLGYLSFDFGATGDNSNMVTWTLVIVVAILGVFIGKRWS